MFVFAKEKKKGLLHLVILYEPPEQLWKRGLAVYVARSVRIFWTTTRNSELPKSDSGAVQLSVCIVVYPLPEPFKNQKSDRKIPRETIILVLLLVLTITKFHFF